MNKFEEVSSLSYQMSLAGDRAEGCPCTGEDSCTVRSKLNKFKHVWEGGPVK